MLMLHASRFVCKDTFHALKRVTCFALFLSYFLIRL